MKWKVKCSSENDYKKLRKAFRNDGIRFVQKEGKSLKVDCSHSCLPIWTNYESLLYLLSQAKIPGLL